MPDGKSVSQRLRQYIAERTLEIWDNLGKNNLWKRVLKNVAATTLLVSICLIPASKQAIGKAAYLGAITTVFGHPGRRFGQLVEALALVVSGTALGVAWSMLGIYLGSLIIERNAPAAYAIRGIFLAIVALLHGFLRSRTPRLFIFVLLMIIASVVSLTSTAKAVASISATQIMYPILVATGCLITINLCIFPEFSSRFLGQMTIDTLNDTSKALESAGLYFVEAQSDTFAMDNICSQGSEDVEKVGNDKIGLKSSTRLSKMLRMFFFGVQSVKGDKTSLSVRGDSLKDLTSNKAKIRKKLEECKTAQQECNFELAISVLPPIDLKPIGVRAMKKLVAHTIAVISACESKFALCGSSVTTAHALADHESSNIHLQQTKSQRPTSDTTPNATGQYATSTLVDEDRKDREMGATVDQDEKEALESIKPKREIEFGDALLLRYLLKRIAKPYLELHKVAARSIEVVSACVAYAFDVPKLPSGARVPQGIMVEEIDMHLENLHNALLTFDANAASALEGASTMEELKGREPDIMPREEIFLLSSFMLNMRQAVTHVEDMLRTSRDLVDRYQHRNGRRRVYAPRIKWSKWLYTGGAEDEAIPTPARKANRQGNANNVEDYDNESSSSDTHKPLVQMDKHKSSDPEKSISGVDIYGNIEPQKPGIKAQETRKAEITTTLSLYVRGRIADALEWAQDSEDVLYSVKLTIALFLVLWPAFVASWNSWYSLNRGLWAALQLVLITEVAIGTSVMTFFLRGIGTTLGCLWGYVAVEARNGNRIVCAAIIFIGLFPCAYVQLGTKYPKAGMVGIVSMCVVALSALLETVPGTPTQDYLKRWIAFMIGGTVAIIVEFTLLPVKARTRLVESLVTTLGQISEMERCIAYGIESGKKIDIFNPATYLRFERASSKANNALSAAETFLPFCSHEPRIKGPFEGLALIYGEILFVLHQIVDRMDNMLQLRTAYGSGPLEELNTDIYPYRRNVAGSITLTLFAIHGALTTKLPLPQYLPSARLAHLRMINRVREVVLAKVSEGQESQDIITKLARQRVLRQKYTAWNAASAAQAEIIEFLEELIDLTKLLVGANEFRSGMLMRPTYQQYAGIAGGSGKDDIADAAETGGEVKETSAPTVVGVSGVRERRAMALSQAESSGMARRKGTISSVKSREDDIPASLRRIQNRKMEAGLKKQRTNES